MTPQEIRDAIDAKLAVLWNKIVSKQTAYHASHGVYWQGLRLFTVTPADGTEETPTSADNTPSDVTTTWIQFLGVDLPGTLEFNLEIHSTGVDPGDGTVENGFLAMVWVEIAGNIYQRQQGYGEASGRSRGWARWEAE